MYVDARAVGSHAASLAWVALRSFLGTVLVLTLVGGGLAAASYYFLREHSWRYAAIAACVTLVESVVAGAIFGAKRALVLALAHGLGALRLGGSMTSLVFERMLGISEEKAGGKPGGRIAKSLERVPLAKAEELLSRAIRGVTGDAQQAGWLRRLVQSRLLAAVQKYTLAQFRAEGAGQGGVDLRKMKDELEKTVDDAVIQRVRRGLRLWTALVIVGLPLLVAGQTWMILLIIRDKG